MRQRRPLRRQIRQLGWIELRPQGNLNRGLLLVVVDPAIVFAGAPKSLDRIENALPTKRQDWLVGAVGRNPNHHSALPGRF